MPSLQRPRRQPASAPPARVTNADLALLIAGAEERLGKRIDRLDGIIKEAGLNGHTDLLKAFLEQYAATYTQRQAWLTVRGDIAHRLRWFATPKSWLKMLGAALIGGIGWRLASSLPHIPLP